MPPVDTATQMRLELRGSTQIEWMPGRSAPPPFHCLRFGCSHSERTMSQLCPLSVERNNPAVQQSFGANHLAAEVVDDQHTVVRLHLQRRGIELTDRIEMKIEHFNSKFSADHHAWPAAKYPAPICIVR